VSYRATILLPIARLPIACTLGDRDGTARMERWKALARRGRPTARQRGHRLEVAYQPEPGVREELEALVAMERQCCSFVAWDVGVLDEMPILCVTADPGAPDGIAAVAGLFVVD
jgi:hypothetical protein